MPDRDLLAFDLGAESGRAIVGSLRQNKLTLEEKHRFPTHNGRVAGHLHWNLLSIWEELKTGLRKSAQGTQLDGIGIDTWGVDYGLIAKTGELLGNPYMYRDARTNGILERTFAKISKEEIFNATGIQFMQLNTLFQLLAMRETLSPLLDIADTLLFIPDLLNYLFTGQRKAEFSIASTSQMYDMRKREWSTELLQKLHLPLKILPPVIPTGTVLGPILKDVADECGVPQITLIAPGCHDTASAVAAVPAEGENWCYISSGTWSLMGVEIPSPIVNDKSLKYNYTNEGGIGGSIRFLKNIMGLWLVQECRRQWQKEGHEYSYAELARLAEQARPFTAIINPDHQPFLAPSEMPQKIEQFCKNTKQTIPSSPGAVIRTCLESLALTYRRTLEILQEVTGKKIDIIHIVGGGSQNELLNQMTADACGKTVIAGPAEATAAGNVLVQAMALGDISNLPALRQIVRQSFELKTYQPKNSSPWDAAYARFRELI